MQVEFARLLGVSLEKLKAWEQDSMQILKNTWEKLRNL